MHHENKAIIDIRDVKFSYRKEDGSFEEPPAVNGVSLTIEEGDYVAVLGPNGSGKSTLAKLIDIIETPDEGSIVVLGHDTKENDSFWEIREQCYCVFQNPDNQIVGTTVEEDVAFGPENLAIPNPELRNRVDKALKATGLYDKRTLQTAFLSGGQKQKLAIAGALAMKPKIIILDESTAMLDPISRNEFLELVEKIREDMGLTIITITHDMNEAARCEKIFVIKNGTVIEQGIPSEVFSDQELMEEAGLDRPEHYKLFGAFEKSFGRSLRSGIDINNEDEAAKRAADEIVKEVRSGAGKITVDPAPRRELSGEPVIEVKDVSFVYLEKNFELKATNLDIQKGEILALVGHTGCGKTTLISHLNALLVPTRGEVLIHDGDRVLKTSNKKDIKAIRSKVGLVFQYPEYQLFEDTVFNDIAYGLKKLGVDKSQHEQRVKEAIALVGLEEDILEKSPFDLSGGQKRRVAMAGVLVMKPEVLVLDEPASGLDPRGRKEMFRIIKNLRDNGTTIVLVTHNMDEAAKNADRICCLGRGEILAITTPEELFSDYDHCRKIGIDIPEITSFSHKIIDNLKAEIPGFKMDEISFASDRLSKQIFNAAVEFRGGLS